MILNNINNNNPLVSIILTSYNYSAYINTAIDSVINQSYKNWELIIIDDGSTDNSLNIINEYIAKYSNKIFLFTHANNSNQGIKLSLELAFTKIKGKYCAFIDSDDYWDPNYLQQKILVIDNDSSISLVLAGINPIVNNQNNQLLNYLEYYRFVSKYYNSKDIEATKLLLMRNIVVSFSNIIFRTELLPKIQLSNKHIYFLDWWLALQLSYYGRFYYIQNNLLNWRIHINSANTKFMNRIKRKIYFNEFKKDMYSNAIYNLINNKNATKLNHFLHSKINQLFFRIKHDLCFFFFSPITILKFIFKNILN